MSIYKHEQRLLSEVPVQGRFKTDPSDRRFYVVLKHYNGYNMVKVEGGRKRKDPDVIIPRTRVKYIASWEMERLPDGREKNIPLWVESVWDNEDVYVIYQEPINDEEESSILRKEEVE